MDTGSSVSRENPGFQLKGSPVFRGSSSKTLNRDEDESDDEPSRDPPPPPSEPDSDPFIWRFVVNTSITLWGWLTGESSEDTASEQESTIEPAQNRPEIAQAIIKPKPGPKMATPSPSIPAKAKESSEERPAPSLSSAELKCEVKKILKDVLEPRVDQLCDLHIERDRQRQAQIGCTCKFCQSKCREASKSRSRSKSCKERSRSKCSKERSRSKCFKERSRPKCSKEQSRSRCSKERSRPKCSKERSRPKCCKEPRGSEIRTVPILPERDTRGRFRRWKCKEDLPERDAYGRFWKLRRSKVCSSDIDTSEDECSKKRSRPRYCKNRSCSKCCKKRPRSKGSRILPERRANGRFCRWKSKEDIPERDACGRFLKLRIRRTKSSCTETVTFDSEDKCKKRCCSKTRCSDKRKPSQEGRGRSKGCGSGSGSDSK